MVRELKIILFVDAITVKMRIERHLAIFFEQLRRVSARTAIDAIDLLPTAATAAAIRAIVSTTAPTVVVIVAVVIPTIVIQG